MLPALTAVQRDFSGGMITEKAARRDDVALQRSGLKKAENTRVLATGALAQRMGRSAYAVDEGRTEIVRFSDTLQYEFLFGDGMLTIRDADGEILNEFDGQAWTLENAHQVGVCVAERDVFLTYGGQRPKHLRLGSVTTLDGSGGTGIGDMLSSIQFPSVAATNSSREDSLASSHSVALPSGITAGDLLVVLFRTANIIGGSSNPSATGWTRLDYVQENDGSTALFVRRATGSEGSTVTVQTGNAWRSTHVSLRITGNYDDPEVAKASSVDPPSLSPSWGAAKTLWLALVGMSRSDQTVTAAPTSYGGLLQIGNSSSSSVDYCRAAAAYRQVEGSSEDPSAFTISGSAAAPHALTVAVRPLSNVAELERAFDGITNKTAAQCISEASSTAAMVGLNISASPQKIASATVYGSNDQGFVQGSTPSVTLTLYGKNGTAPSGPTDGTSLGSTTFTDSANESSGRSITSSDTTTDYDYVWVAITHNGSAATIYAAQVVIGIPSTVLSEDNWLIGPYLFEETAEGALRQPYVRYAARGIAMLPSARSGAINVTFDGPVLDASHVGVSFRFHEREIVITAVTSPTAGTANVIEKLPPLRRVTCTDANGRDGFKIGQVVIGATSGAEGLIVAFNSTANLDVIVYKGDNFVASERIVSPTGNTAVSGTPTEQTIAGSTVWDEAAMSDFRGWPRSVAYDRSRLVFCDFPQSPRAIAWSAIGLSRDLLIGAEAADGFLEFAPGAGRVRHVIGGADQFVITDLGVMYIPISEANPLRPGSVSFRPIAAIGGGDVRPAQMHEGIVYATPNSKTLVAVVPTGQTSFPYRTATISEFHADLFTGVRGLAAMAGGGNEVEQYLWVVQDDGTALVGKFDSSKEWVGFVPVTGEGLIRWICSLGGEVRFNVEYDTGWMLEYLDDSQFVDCAVPLNRETPALRPDPEDLTQGRLWFLAGLDVALMDGETYLGTRTVDADGFIEEEEGDDFSGEDVVAGFAFTVDVRPWLPNQGEGQQQGQRMRRRRVKRAGATVQDSTAITFMGRSFGGTAAASDTYRAPGRGREFDPEVTLLKTTPGPLRILELTAEITT